MAGASDDVRPDVTAPTSEPATARDALSLLALTVPIIVYVVGVLRWEWGINELTALVFLGAFVVGVLQRYTLSDTAKRLIAGMEAWSVPRCSSVWRAGSAWSSPTAA